MNFDERLTLKIFYMFYMNFATDFTGFCKVVSSVMFFTFVGAGEGPHSHFFVLYLISESVLSV